MGYGQVLGCCELNVYETSGSIKREEFLDYIRTCWLIKTESLPRSLSVTYKLFPKTILNRQFLKLGTVGAGPYFQVHTASCLFRNIILKPSLRKNLRYTKLSILTL